MISRRRRIVLTGAWGGGKTTLIQELQADKRYRDRVITLPEAAPQTRRDGYDPSSLLYEKMVLEMQHCLEDKAEAPQYPADFRLVIVHRGALDALGFWLYSGRQVEEFFHLTGAALEEELARYDAIILLRSTAHDAGDIYARYRQEKDRGTSDEAIRLEDCLERAWSEHPRFFSIPNKGLGWREKADLAHEIIDPWLDFVPATMAEVNNRLDQLTYPSTHQYHVDENHRMHPSPTASARLDELSQILPHHSWQSMIDIGCGKGMFLIWAAQRFHLKRVTGIDTSSEMIHTARLAADYLGAPATFLLGRLDQFHPILKPADLVMMFHCFHYVYFSPSIPVEPSKLHEYWFSMIASITTDTLVFANALDLTAKQAAYCRQQGVSEDLVASYNEKGILEAASRYFDLQPFSLGGGRPLILMRKKDAA